MDKVTNDDKGSILYNKKGEVTGVYPCGSEGHWRSAVWRRRCSPKASSWTATLYRRGIATNPSKP